MSKSLSTLQASLKVQVLIYLFCLCKNLFWRHAQTGARVEDENSNVKHCGGPLLPEAVSAYVCPIDSAGTTTCPGYPTTLAAPLTVFALPPWASPKFSLPPSASPPSCRAPALFLSPYAVLLSILGS